MMRVRRLLRGAVWLALITLLAFLALAKPADLSPYAQSDLARLTAESIDAQLRALGPTPAAAPIEMGVAKLEIAPPETWRVPMAGNRGLRFRRARGKRPESVWARAVALRQADRELILVSADIMVISPALSRGVLDRIRPSTGIEAGELFLVAAHTHNGPGGYWDGFLAEQSVGPYDPRVLEFLIDRLARAALEARQNVRPARLAVGRRSMEAPIRNRAGRIELENPSLDLLRIEALDGSMVAELVGFSAHPVSMLRHEPLLSGDYPALMAERVDDGRRTMLFLPGTIGDMKPVWDGTREPLAKGLAIAGHLVEEGLDRVAVREVERPVLEAFELSLAMPPLQPRLFRSDALGSWVLRDWLVSPLFPDDLTQTVVQVARLGPVALVGAPADLASSLALPLLERAESRGLEMLFVSMADDWIGYLMEEREYLESDYKEPSQFHGPSSGPLFIDVYDRLIDWLADRSSGSGSENLSGS